MDKHIDVFPKISGLTKKKDPDVDLILGCDQKDNLNIMDLQHEPTKEEKAQENNPPSQPWSWVIITLAIIVIVLIIVIVWYVLKENEECNTSYPNMVPRQIIRPNQMYNPIHPAYQFNHPMHPINRPQMENLPINTASMNEQKIPQTKINQNKQPSKEELIATLNQMKIEPIEEEPQEKKLKPSKQQVSIVEQNENDIPGEDKEDEQDEILAQKFYNNLQQNINNDDADDPDENMNNND